MLCGPFKLDLLDHLVVSALLSQHREPQFQVRFSAGQVNSIVVRGSLAKVTCFAEAGAGGRREPRLELELNEYE